MSNTKAKKISTRMLVGVGMMTAVAYVLQIFEFPIPMLVPSFMKFDFSDLPALLGAYAYGPVAGVFIELVKNLLHCAVSQSATVGELANFLLGAFFVFSAGFIYKLKKSKKTALIGGITGAIVMGIISIPVNYFITYPFYFKVWAPKEAVIGAYKAIIPSVQTLLQCLLIFNLPFTIVKGIICVIISMLIYKPLSKILKG